MSVEVAKKAYFEAKRAHEAERNRLTELEKRLGEYRRRLEEHESILNNLQEERLRMIGVVAGGQCSESKLAAITKKIDETNKELTNLVDLAQATQEATDQSRRSLESFRDGLAEVEKNVWRAVIPSLKQELEEAIGDRLQKLWVAIIEAGLSCRPLYAVDLPADLPYLITPNPIKDFRDELWKSIIG